MLSSREKCSLPFPRFLLADPCSVSRFGVRQALDLAPWQVEHVDEVERLSEIPTALSQYRSNILIMELALDGNTALSALQTVNYCVQNWRHISVVVYTAIHHAPLFQILYAMNVRGIYLKREPIDELLQCIEQVLQGDYGFSSVVSHSLPKAENTNHFPLTKKELEILMLLFNGKNVTTIAKLLKRDIRTVSAHKRNAMRKIGFKTDSEMFSNSKWMTVPLYNLKHSIPFL